MLVVPGPPVEIWACKPRDDEENHREAAWHAKNGRQVLVHEHCHTLTCRVPQDTNHRHGDCPGRRHWRSDGFRMREAL